MCGAACSRLAEQKTAGSFVTGWSLGRQRSGPTIVGHHVSNYLLSSIPFNQRLRNERLLNHRDQKQHDRDDADQAQRRHHEAAHHLVEREDGLVALAPGVGAGALWAVEHACADATSAVTTTKRALSIVRR